MLQLIYKKFKFVARKTTLKKELIGGIITFFAMIYILPVNSNILNDHGNGVPYGGVFVATALIGAIGSIMIGYFSNLPIGIASGMGSNVFFVSTMMKQFHMRWELALSVVIINGILFLVLSIIGFVDKFIKSAPTSIKYTFVLGLGVYLAYLGLKGSGIIAFSSNGFKLGDITNVKVILAIVGILLIFTLSIKKVKMSILISLCSMALVGMIIGQVISNHLAKGLNSFTDFNFDYSQLHQFNNVFGKGITFIPSAFIEIRTYPALLALTFMTLSGSSGTIVSVGELSKLENKKGEIEGSKKALISVGCSSTIAGVLGTSSAGGFLESNAGVASGARTGVASICTGLLFLISIPLFPVLQPLFNHEFVTSPILIFVGSMMMLKVNRVKWTNPVIAGSSFILLIIMWFTSSILNGLAFGIVSYVIFEIASGNWKKININMYIFAILFLGYIISIPFLF